jgi:hypothetical protein
MCIDKLKVRFTKKADLKHSGALPTPYQLHHHSTAAHVTASPQQTHNVAAAHASATNPATQHVDAGSHSQLLSLSHDPGLTGQFQLPAVEHLLG